MSEMMAGEGKKNAIFWEVQAEGPASGGLTQGGPGPQQQQHQHRQKWRWRPNPEEVWPRRGGGSEGERDLIRPSPTWANLFST